MGRTRLAFGGSLRGVMPAGLGVPQLWLSSVAFAAVFSGVLDATLRPRGASDRERGDFNGRLTLWPDAREEFWDHPFLGRGVDSFAATNPLRIAAHNALLDVGTGLGVLGIALFVALIWQALKPRRILNGLVPRARVLPGRICTDPA